MIEADMLKDLIKAVSLFIVLLSIFVVSFELVVNAVFNNITNNFIYDSLLYIVVLAFGVGVVTISYQKYVEGKDE